MRTFKPAVIHLFSGGVDSTVMLHEMLRDGCHPHCLLVYYGQKHFRELDYATKTCERLGVPYTEKAIDGIFADSFLTGSGIGDVIIPNRNAVLLHIACSIGLAKRADAVTIACNADDRGVFPDCAGEFIDSVNASLKLAKLSIEVMAPYTGLSKWQIVQRGRELDVPFSDCYSCYSGAATPCGKCLACVTLNAAMQTHGQRLYDFAEDGRK